MTDGGASAPVIKPTLEATSATKSLSLVHWNCLQLYCNRPQELRAILAVHAMCHAAQKSAKNLQVYKSAVHTQLKTKTENKKSRTNKRKTNWKDLQNAYMHQPRSYTHGTDPTLCVNEAILVCIFISPCLLTLI